MAVNVSGKTLPWKGIDLLDVDELGQEIHARLNKLTDGRDAQILIEGVAEYLDETWGLNTTTSQDLIYDYLDDWLDHVDGFSPNPPPTWDRYVLGEEGEPEPVVDPYEERFKRIEGQLEAIHDHLNVIAKDTQWQVNWAARAGRFNEFHKEFEEAGTEAAEIAKAVSDLTQMAAELAPKTTRVVRRKR